jgi:hypothetical protein
MKTRQVFSTPDVTAAREAIAAARQAGAPDDAVSLIARSDIEMDSIPEGRLEASGDTVPAGLRGAAAGGATGLIAGLIGVAIPPLGITVAGIGLLAMIGAAVGGWSSALFGSGVPNPVRRRFEEEIDAGRILVVVDDDRGRAAVVRSAVEATGAVTLPFEQASATT